MFGNGDTYMDYGTDWADVQFMDRVAKNKYRFIGNCPSTISFENTIVLQQLGDDDSGVVMNSVSSYDILSVGHRFKSPLPPSLNRHWMNCSDD